MIETTVLQFSIPTDRYFGMHIFTQDMETLNMCAKWLGNGSIGHLEAIQLMGDKGWKYCGQEISSSCGVSASPGCLLMIFQR